MRYRAIIFDWDGTLMDSTAKLVESFVYAAAKVNAPRHTKEQYLKTIGLNADDALSLLYPNDEVDKAALKAAFSHHYQHLNQQSSPLFDGVETLLHMLQNQGYLLAIATSKQRGGLNALLQKTALTHRFAHSKTAEETQPKPNPAMLHALCEEMRVPPEKCLMVGDTSFDLLMAKRANMDSVGVLCGAHVEAELQPCAPQTVLERTSQLGEWLTRAK